MGGKRLDVNGNRTCKHTRLVDQDRADSEAVSFKDYEAGTVSPKKKAAKVATPAKSPVDKDLDELDKNWELKRKIKWK
jgi:hypothetical protein